MNTVQLMGRWAADHDVRYTNNQKMVLSNRLAVNRPKKENGEQEADFINVVAFGKTAELIERYTTKGQQLGLEGRIQTRNYENQQGQRVYVTEVLVSRVHFISSQKTTQNNAQNQSISGGYGQSGINTQQGNYNANANGFQTQNQYPGGNQLDGSPVDISEDDLPF